MSRNKKNLLRDFHQAKWDEQIIFEMHTPGERGIFVPQVESSVKSQVGDELSDIPKVLRRDKPPALPEINQFRVLRHFFHLSQETLGTDVTIDISQGTCTMKYSPKVQEHIATRNPGVTEIHPLQNENTIQGLLEITYKLEMFLKEISGMDFFTFQPAGGAQGVYTSATMIRKFHQHNNNGHKNEIITTVFSHPCDAAAPATAGYKVITLMPDENGYPSLEALNSVLSDKTAAIFITNPEDTGLYNPKISEFVKAAHSYGAICHYDQANANGLLGITRAKEAGFDICQFNLHKTFSIPHGCMGGSVGAVGFTKKLFDFMPVPHVEFVNNKYVLNYNIKNSIGKIRSFLGNPQGYIRSYLWIMQLGEQGLKEVAQCAVLNNNYMAKKLSEIPGVTIQYSKGEKRLEQVRYSWNKLKQDTGVDTTDVMRRMVDYGLQSYWTSHHPWIVPEPFTLEPCESYSKDDIDEYVAILNKISKEAYADPEFIKNSPHNSVVHKVDNSNITNPDQIAVTWRQYLKKQKLD